MKLTLILYSVMLALVVVPELVAARATPKMLRPSLDEKVEGTNKWCDFLFKVPLKRNFFFRFESLLIYKT